MSFRSLVAVLPLAFFAAAAASQTISEDSLRRHIQILASDAFEGRRPGTPGGERTEAYLADAFERVGLQPGSPDGSWRQNVRVLERRPGATSARWRGRRGPVRIAPDAIVMLGREPRVRLPESQLVFVGYGLPENLEGVPLAGKVVLHLPGSPPGTTGAPRIEERRAAIVERGAAAVIAIAPREAPWQQLRAKWQMRTIEKPERQLAPPEGMISAAAAADLLRAAGSDLGELTRRAAAPGFRPQPLGVGAGFDIETDVSRFESANIVGKIPGTSRPDEAVVLLAHWDHLGICRPEGAPDRICNGAVDNASGTAILIEVARHLAAGPRPGRTIYILATTAEEGGLLGAEAFVSAPPVPAGSIVAALNLDTTAIGPAGLPVAIIGRGNYPALEAVIDETVRSAGRTVDPDTEANVMVTRQDGWAFAGRGIPAVMVTGSVSEMKRLQAYLGGVYHGPDDDLAHLTELGGAAEDATLHIALARALADPRRYTKR